MTTTTDTAALKELVCKLTDAVLNVVARSEAEGWERAAKWIDARREAYDKEHSQYDTETGMTEFSNAASEEYSTELYDISEGLRAEIKPAGAAALARVKELEGKQVPLAWTDAEELRDIEQGYTGYLYKIDPTSPHIDPRRQILLYDRPQRLANVPYDVLFNAISKAVNIQGESLSISVQSFKEAIEAAGCIVGDSK